VAYDPLVTRPEILGELAGERVREKTLKVPENLAYLEGHFPKFPVVPAAVQIQWVMAVAREMLETEPILQRLEALRFKAPLRPAQVFRLTLQLLPSGDTLDFRLWDEDQIFSSGRCLLAPAGRTRA